MSARVIRDGTWQLIPARELVPGDIIRLRTGDIIPADIKLFTCELSVDQSALTGESLDVDKKVGDILSSGSVVCSLAGKVTELFYLLALILSSAIQQNLSNKQNPNYILKLLLPKWFNGFSLL